MSASGLDVFDRTLQTTHVWLNELMDSLGSDRQAAWHVLGAVLHALRDRLPPGLAAHLGAQLPLLVRGLYYDQWHPRSKPIRLRSARQFLDEVGKGLGNIRPVDTQDATRAVFQLLNHTLDPGQVQNVREALSERVRGLWPANAEDAKRAENTEGALRHGS